MPHVEAPARFAWPQPASSREDGMAGGIARAIAVAVAVAVAVAIWTCGDTSIGDTAADAEDPGHRRSLAPAGPIDEQPNTREGATCRDGRR